MSYCVHCGVELERSEKFCPLCKTEVLNLRDPWKEEYTRPYPTNLEWLEKRIDRQYGAALAGIILLIPVLITVLCDLFISHSLSWSAYVLGAGLCLFVYILLPMLYRRGKVLLFLFADLLITLLYLAMIEATSSGTWFLRLGLPICVSAALFLLSCYLVLHAVRLRGKGLKKVAIILLLFGVWMNVVNLIIRHFMTGAFGVSWGLIVLLACIGLSIVFASLERRAKLKEEISRRLFI